MAIQRCPKITIKLMPKLENLVIENTEVVVFPTKFDLGGLKTLSITGRRKPIKYDQEIGTTVTMSDGILGSTSSKPEVTLTNTRITQFPRQMILTRLTIETSLFPVTEQKILTNINSVNIDQLEITKSDILSVFKLGLYSYSKPFTFSDNQVHSTCQTDGDNQKCFLQPHDSLVYQ